MQAKQMLTDWIRIVQDLVGELHQYQVQAMAELSFAWLRAGTPFATEWGCHLPSGSLPASTRRRTERFVANERIQRQRFVQLWTESLLEQWLSPGADVLLILDETSGHRDQFRRMQLSLAYCGRAIPLTWRCTRGKPRAKTMPQMVVQMLQEVQQQLPKNCRVTLLLDRGLAWPAVLQAIEAWDWDYVARLQGTTRTIDDSGTETTARQRVKEKGDHWFGKVQAFKKHGWMQGQLSAVWAKDCKVPWLLFSRSRASLARVSNYARRMWIEEEFRDDKSSGLDWQQSQITDPEHAGRQLILGALATLLALSLGAWGHQSDQRNKVDPHRRRWRYSLFSLGRLLLNWWCNQPHNNGGRMKRLYQIDPQTYDSEQPTRFRVG